MAHALTEFIRQQMDERRMRNADVERASGLSRQLVSKLVIDHREKLTRLPERATLEGVARAFHVPLEFVLGKAIESMGLGFSAGDFVNDVTSASNDELLAELGRRLRASERAGSPRLDAVWPGGSFQVKTAARPGEPQDLVQEAEADELLHQTQDNGGLEPL